MLLSLFASRGADPGGAGPAGAAPGRPTSGGTAAGGAGPVGPVRSGEEILTSDGRFVRLPDPTKAEGSPVDEDWQQALTGALATALAKGREQVVLVFTREGCPWCDQQMPILRKAIQRRAGRGDVGGDVGAAFTSPSTLAGGSLLFAPLRVFIIDAGEFL